MRTFGCNAFIYEDGKVLLVKGRYEPFKGLWSLPGGIIEEGETAEECVSREVKEETGLDVEPIKLISIYSHPERDPRKIIVALYFCRATPGKIKKGSGAAGARWFSINELPALVGDRKKMIEDAFEHL